MLNQASYSMYMRSLHWIMGAMIICLLIVGFRLKYLSADQRMVMTILHKTFGVIALVLLVMRLFVRSRSTIPVPIGAKWMQCVAKITVVLLYIGMIAMAFSGYLMSSFGGYPIKLFNTLTLPNFWTTNLPMAKVCYMTHITAALPFAILIGLHIGAAIYHHFILKDNVLKRMLFRS